MAKINIKKFKETLKGSGGNQSTIAQKLDVSRQAVSKFLSKNSKMRELLEEEAERIIDVAENVIDSDIVKGKNIDSSKWKLLHSKRGKARGYGIKQEIDHSGEGLKITILKADDEQTRNRLDAQRKTGDGPESPE